MGCLSDPSLRTDPWGLTLLAPICHEPFIGARQLLLVGDGLGRVRLPYCSSLGLESVQFLSLLPPGCQSHQDAGLGTSVEAGWIQPRAGVLGSLPSAVALPSPGVLARAWYTSGDGS